MAITAARRRPTISPAPSGDPALFAARAREAALGAARPRRGGGGGAAAVDGAQPRAAVGRPGGGGAGAGRAHAAGAALGVREADANIRPMRAPWLVPALLALGCALRPAPAPASPAAAPDAVIPLTLPSGRVFQTELMIDDEDRAMGLMFRPSLPADRALLFVFDDLDFHGIWMKNCRFPIDIVWLDENRKVVHVAARVPPARRTRARPTPRCAAPPTSSR